MTSYLGSVESQPPLLIAIPRRGCRASQNLKRKRRFLANKMESLRTQESTAELFPYGKGEHRMKRAGLLALALWLLHSALPATGLDDLRAALERLRAREPLRARVTHETSTQSKEDGELKTRQSRGSVVAEDGGPGKTLHLIYEDSLILEAWKEQSLGRQNVSGPRDALHALSAVQVSEHLRGAEKLLDELKGAELVKESSETREGHAVRKLELKLAPPPGAEKEKGLKTSRTARIWVDESGVPIGSELQSHAEMRKLIFKMQADTAEKSTYAVSGGRLVKSRHESDQKSHVSGGHSLHVVVAARFVPASHKARLRTYRNPAARPSPDNPLESHSPHLGKHSPHPQKSGGGSPSGGSR